MGRGAGERRRSRRALVGRALAGTALVAIDWGTSSARAYRLDASGAIVGVRRTGLGVRHIRDGGFEAAMSGLLGDWADDRAPRIACGMIGSRQGWIEAPYVGCPASLDALADKLVRTPVGALSIVPGISTRDRAGIPDVMRGEETQLLGAVGFDEHVVAVLPGTHSKWARVEHGSVVEFTTFMTGELYALLVDHSMLGRVAGHEPGPFSRDAYMRGAARGLDDGELAHDLFGARTLSLAGELPAAGVTDWLSGLLIGREIRAALAWLSRSGIGTPPVRIIGADALVERYDLALGDAGVATERAAHDAAASGLWRIAQRASLVPA